MASLWQQTATLSAFQPLRQNIKTDVLVIGGGMAGVLCAHLLCESGVRCVVAEAATLGSGITKNTTAKVTLQHGLIYQKLLRKAGADLAGQYLAANRAALDAYRSLCQTIDCDFEEQPAYTYSLDNRARIEAEISALHTLGLPAQFVQELPLPFPVAGAVRLDGQAQFHPLKFLSALAKGLTVYEHTAVRKLDGTTATTDHGTIAAQKVIVATHFPFLNHHGSYFLKLYQHRSYVLALENAPTIHGMYVDDAQNGLSFRSYENLLLLGGGDHRTGKKGGGWQELRSFAGRHYPDATEQSHWATQDCMTLDGTPYIGPYSSHTPHVYVATGFNKWGMTSAMVSAMLLCDAVQGRKSPYAEVFSPSRSILHPQLAVNAWEATLHLLTPTAKRCPHMGCALKWNPHEHSWDCPCHGSRFDAQGRLIDNPAVEDLKR